MVIICIAIYIFCHEETFRTVHIIRNIIHSKNQLHKVSKQKLCIAMSIYVCNKTYSKEIHPGGMSSGVHSDSRYV